MLDAAELDKLVVEIERVAESGRHAIASTYMAKIMVEQIKASQDAKKSADRYSGILIFVTLVIVILTVVLVMLTIRLVRHGG